MLHTTRSAPRTSKRLSLDTTLKQENWKLHCEDIGDLIESMNKLAEITTRDKTFGLTPRADHKKDFNTFAPNDMTLQDREATLKGVLISFAQGLEKVTEDRLLPATVVVGAPGTGKSRILDEIARLREVNGETLSSLLEGVPPKQREKMMQFIKKWIPVSVTWNGQTPYDPYLEENDLNGTKGLAVRMLYTHWFVDSSVTKGGFERFMKCIGDFNKETLFCDGCHCTGHRNRHYFVVC